MTLEERLKSTLGELLFNQCSLSDQIERSAMQLQNLQMQLDAANKKLAGLIPEAPPVPPLPQPRAKKG